MIEYCKYNPGDKVIFKSESEIRNILAWKKIHQGKEYCIHQEILEVTLFDYFTFGETYTINILRNVEAKSKRKGLVDAWGFSTYDPNHIFYIGDFFYTKNEIRKQKLLKINDNSNLCK